MSVRWPSSEVLFSSTHHLWREREMCFGVVFHLAARPEHRVILDVPPGIDHVVVVTVEGMAGLAGCMHRERALEILEVYNQALGGHCNDSIRI